MAVVILKKGVLPEDKLYAHTCDHCGCEFTFLRRDADFTSDQRDGDYLEISCPTCGRDARVSP